MKVLALYTLAAMIAFVIYSMYFAVVGDNAPFWIIIVIACLPVIAFTSIYLIKNNKMGRVS